MSKFDFPESIKSRPVWGQLSAREGAAAHLFVADAEGAEAIIEMEGAAGVMQNAHIIYIPGREDMSADLKALDPAQLHVAPTYSSTVQRLRRVLEASHMGLQVYLAGTEGLMGQAMAECMAAGIPHEAIQTEHRGSTARRMQCVHCKGITEEVEMDPFTCSHCGLSLFVRDHYSRRLAAYQGVRVDAEDHGNVPAACAIYP